jgi:hypothetical protein
LRPLIAAVSKASAIDSPRVALCGELAGLLCADGDLDAAMAVEEIANDLFKVHQLDILCAYPLFRWRHDDVVFGRVCTQHSAVRYM